MRCVRWRRWTEPAASGLGSTVSRGRLRFDSKVPIGDVICAWRRGLARVAWDRGVGTEDLVRVAQVVTIGDEGRGQLSP
ncbi:hypothetical protein LIA77_01963 [Sarocladium implicatum]|jgi:hypothetical protein|nr:hypothetical protein LIA77_01963 [Sarocladium implicatum]